MGTSFARRGWVCRAPFLFAACLILPCLAGCQYGQMGKQQEPVASNGLRFLLYR